MWVEIRAFHGLKYSDLVFLCHFATFLSFPGGRNGFDLIFIRQDLPDLRDFFRIRERPLGRRPLDPDDPVNPVQLLFIEKTKRSDTTNLQFLIVNIQFRFVRVGLVLLDSAAWAAHRRATGTLKGEQDT
jgi:hypothetical protein